MKRFFDNKEKITKAFLLKRASAAKNFWCHTKEADDFYTYWDKKWQIIQKYLDKEWQKITCGPLN